MTTRQQRVDDEILDHQQDLLGVSNRVWRTQVLPLLRDLERDILVTLARIDPTEPERLTYRQRRLNRLLAEVRALIEGQYREISREMRRALGQVARGEAAVTASALTAGLGVDIAEASLTQDTIRNIILNDFFIEGASSREWWMRQGGNLAYRFQREMRIGVLQGESVAELGSRTRTLMRGKTQQEAESLVRTSVINAANGASIETYRQNRDIIKGMRWLTTIDDRRSDICKGLHGKEWDLDYNPIGHSTAFPGPTAHWQCRSTQRPILKTLEELEQENTRTAQRVVREQAA